MARVTAQEYAEKHARRLKGSLEDIRRGVQRVTEAPGEAAARAQDTMKTKLVQSIDDGTWAAQTRAVTLPDWQKATLDKGVNRIAAGVDAALPRQAAMAERLLQAVDASVAIVNRTKRGTLEDNITRMVTYAREMAQRKLRKPGSR